VVRVVDPEADDAAGMDPDDRHAPDQLPDTACNLNQALSQATRESSGQRSNHLPLARCRLDVMINADLRISFGN
jgi:hypothetical protein